MKLDPFYLIVDEARWLERLLPLGVRLVQLRIKDKPEALLHAEIAEAHRLCRAAGAQLVVNDYWQIAIDLGCDFIHLGQEDLETADLAAIRRHGLKLGLSTHDAAELDRALAVSPDYIALGPVFPTISKEQAVAPLGLAGLTEWRRLIGPLPLCAIGGIDLDRAKLCLAAGADIVSVISDVLLNADPEGRARQWIAATRPA